MATHLWSDAMAGQAEESHLWFIFNRKSKTLAS